MVLQIGQFTQYFERKALAVAAIAHHQAIEPGLKCRRLAPGIGQQIGNARKQLGYRAGADRPRQRADPADRGVLQLHIDRIRRITHRFVIDCFRVPGLGHAGILKRSPARFRD